MYRTPGRVSASGLATGVAGGRSSRGSSPQSQAGSYLSSGLDGQDRVIKHLRKELTTIKKNSKVLSETTTRLTNLQHKYNIVLAEKIRDEESHRRKENEQEIEIGRLLDELRLAKERLTNKDSEVGDLRVHYQKLEHAVTSKEELLAQTERDLAAEFEQYQQLNDEKNRLENDKGSLLKQQTEHVMNAEQLAMDITTMKDDVQKFKRRAKEHKSSVTELKTQNTETLNEIYRLEEELKNLSAIQQTKEVQILRQRERSAVIENDINLIDSEKDTLHAAIRDRDESLKYLAEIKAEHLRKETLLAKDRITVDQSLEESERELAHHREEITVLENEALSSKSELKGLQAFYERLVAENRKLVEGLKFCHEVDEKASRALDRTEKIDHVILEANREITTAIKIVRD